MQIVQRYEIGHVFILCYYNIGENGINVCLALCLSYIYVCFLITKHNIF